MRNLDIAACIRPAVVADEVLPSLFKLLAAAFAVGSVTVAPAYVDVVDRSAAAAWDDETVVLATAEGLPITWTTHPSSNLYSSTTSPPSFSGMTRPRKISFNVSNGTDVISDALRRSSDAVTVVLIPLSEGEWRVSCARGAEGEDVKER